MNGPAQPGRVTEPESAASDGLLLAARDVSKHYGAVHALRDASLEVRPGEIHGLCGHNGAGKSTLVKILTGVVQPDAGAIEHRGQPVSFRTPRAAQLAGIALVDQELSLAPDLSVEENIFLGSATVGLFANRAQLRKRARDLLSRVGLDQIEPTTMVQRLAIGERQLVEIARGLSRDAEVLILDEPTATLSEAEIERVFSVSRALAREGKGMIYISHRLGEVLELCDRVTVVRDGRVVATRSTAEIGERQTLIRMMIDRELPIPTETAAPLVEQVSTTEIRGLAVPPVVKGFELRIPAGQIVGITGQVGCGASEVLRAVAGLVPDARGVVVVDGRPVRLGSPARALRAGIAFASNDRKGEGLFLRRSVGSNLLATRLRSLSPAGLVRRTRSRRVASELCSFVKVETRRLPSAADTLSGGNQQKVFLGRCLDRTDIKLLVFDEPTRGVDVGGRAEIHELLREASLAGVSVLFASTEIDEILELSQVVVTMFGGEIVATRPRSEVTAELLSADMTMSRERAALEAGSVNR
jgi:ABC-type sugar transport system ATPase subunit